ncbi:MAG: glycosyltransferase [Phycisphaera sp.]|nr:glycosyltransferase [Phycisphaera sp.]
MPSRADVHCHSRYSDRPSEWLLRRIGAPECYTQPRAVYDAARRAGMDFVTISDHNCIDGALEIADLPGTFISNEATVYFPEDGCKMHILTIGITPEQFKVIQEVRENIYDFRDYCVRENIIHSVAHTFFTVNEKLTPDHVEKLLVLFNRFEGINGTRDPRACEMVNAIFRNTTPEMIQRFADKHGITPVGDTPWKKTFTAGSDDHSGLYIASAFTVTPVVETVEQYLQKVRQGDHEMGGSHGSSVHLAHCFYHIAYDYFRDRFFKNSTGGPNLLDEMLKQMLNPPAPRPSTIGGRMKEQVTRFIRNRRMKKLTDTERMLVDDFAELFDAKALNRPQDVTAEQHNFELSCRVSQQLSYTFFKKFLKKVREGEFVKGLQTFSSLGPVALAIAPYLAAFKTQHKDEKLLQELAKAFPAAAHMARKSERAAIVTDSFNDAIDAQRIAHELGIHTSPVTVVTCQEVEPPRLGDALNFKPVGTFRLPDLEEAPLVFPPFLEVMHTLERENFGSIVVTTPGPMGLAALAAARLLKVGIVGYYHTDLVELVHQMADDQNVEHFTRRYVSWFFSQLDEVIVPDETHRLQMLDAGLAPERIRVVTQSARRLVAV